VPLFQEQLLRIAMTAAGFSGGEAEELRRAMGFKRSRERMERLEARLRAGMTARGLVGSAQDDVVRGITSFALYGFPESHAASFAGIAWASPGSSAPPRPRSSPASSTPGPWASTPPPAW
jgi:error-prone DNA polymerase